jgi:hypothetical protein
MEGKGTGNRCWRKKEYLQEGAEQVRSEKHGSRKGKETMCIEEEAYVRESEVPP